MSDDTKAATEPALFIPSRPPYSEYPPGAFVEAYADGFRYVEPKYDGWWGEFVGDEGGWTVYSRTGKVKAAGPEPMPFPIHLKGEYLRGTQWSKREGRSGLFMAFDSQPGASPGLSAKYVDRRAVVTNLVNEVQAAGLGWMREGDWYDLDEDGDVASTLWVELIIDGDWEGLVFKDEAGNCARMKKVVTMDYICLGVAESDSETYKGQARALLGGLYVPNPDDPDKPILKQIVSISGLTAAQREAFWARREDLKGLVFEATGKLLFKSGALRHPSFERWRDDKPAADCVWPQEE